MLLAGDPRQMDQHPPMAGMSNDASFSGGGWRGRVNLPRIELGYITHPGHFVPEGLIPACDAVRSGTRHPERCRTRNR